MNLFSHRLSLGLNRICLPFYKKREELDPHIREVLSGASVAFVLKLLAAGVGFSFNVVLARLLGPKDTGLYFLALTVTTIATVFGRLGLDNTLVRFTASNASVGDWGAVKGLYGKGIRLALAGSSVTTLLLVLVAPWLAKVVFNEPKLTILIRWMSLAVMPSALYTLYSDLLRGLKRIPDAILVVSIFLPASSLLGITWLIPLWGLKGAILAHVQAALLTVAIGAWRWHKASPQLEGLAGSFETKQLLNSCIPLFWVALLQLVMTWSSNLILGMKTSSADVALFTIANNTSTLINFILVAVNTIAAPKFATLYHQGDLQVLGRLARNCTKIMTLIASPVVLTFILVPRWVMGIFGTGFSGGGTVLAILAVGQFINVATGSVGVLLMMCGHERLLRNNLLICAAINLLLNITLISFWGVMGAAIATAITLSMQMLISVALVWWKLGIVTIPLPWKRLETSRL